MRVSQSGLHGLDVRSVTFNGTSVGASDETGGLLGRVGGGAEVYTEMMQRDRSAPRARQRCQKK